MPINPNELQKWIAAYQQKTGEHVTRFVCPILDIEIEDADLINGHIINKALEHVPKSKVIQYGKIDGFYGTRTEAAFVHYMNAPSMTPKDRVAKACYLAVILPDGSEIEAFITNGDTPLPSLRFPQEDGSILNIYLKTANDDPRLKDPRNSQPVPNRPGEYVATAVPIIKMQEGPFMQTQWAASALKVAYLTDFHMRGYDVLFDPFMQPVREVLRNYFRNDGKADDCPTYFDKFRNALRSIAFPDDGGGFLSLNENTIEHRVALIHYSAKAMVFGISFIIPIRNIEFIFTMPYGNQYSVLSQVMDDYAHFVQTDFPGTQMIQKAKYKNGTWHPEAQIASIQFPENIPDNLQEHLDRIVTR